MTHFLAQHDLRHSPRIFAAWGITFGLLASCASEDAGAQAAQSAAASATASAEVTSAAVAKESEMISNLPYSRGRSFSSLDEYLAHLEKNGEIDLPYWRRIGPDLYEWVVRMPGAERKTATRAELMRLYGFTR